MAKVLTFTTASPRFEFTLQEAERIRQTGFRYDSSWRHADLNSNDLNERMKAVFYERCCTFAANDMADNPEMADFWRGQL